jgi:hypothetical protein
MALPSQALFTLVNTEAPRKPRTRSMQWQRFQSSAADR